ncbi:hypothetical protein [Natronorubrum sp. A-ect3]|uniref:hypothetical protein n=1 Tax=Natronorubrum sp. A-ect3 TaxID=3242698 RepID=UPI00359D5A40
MRVGRFTQARYTPADRDEALEISREAATGYRTSTFLFGKETGAFAPQEQVTS